MAVNKTPIEVLEGQLYKGLKMFRQIEECKLAINEDYIWVTYWQWLESPTGDVLEKVFKAYKVMDEPGKDEYTKWANFTITEDLIGAKLGNDIIIASIRGTLAVLPFDVKDGYITQP